MKVTVGETENLFNNLNLNLKNHILGVSLFYLNGNNMQLTGIQFSPNGNNLISDYTGGLITGMYILQIRVGNETKTATIVSGNN